MSNIMKNNLGKFLQELFSRGVETQYPEEVNGHTKAL